jgi:hypothetical protein
MKIRGPKGPKPAAPPKPSIEESTGKPLEKSGDSSAGQAGQVGTTFDKLLDSSVSGTNDPLSKIAADIASRVRNGELNKAEAGQALIDSIVQMRGRTLGPEAQQRLRDVLAATLASDPVLSAKLDRLDPDG